MSKLDSKSLKVYALGGLCEVGKNMYCIEYMDQIFIIDCGILFPDKHLLGVDYVIPDFSYLLDKQDKIVALFITHGHEDHIGGIPFFLKEISVPKIYAAGVSIELIKNKLEEHKDIRVPELVTFDEKTVLEYKNTKISFVRMTHSVPDTFGVYIETKAGSIFHTGDFKFDMTPNGPNTEFFKLSEIGHKGLDLLLSDSTNATVPGYTKSEKVIGSNILELFKHTHSRLLVATFASNIYRVQQIVDAAVKTNRKIVVFGRSMVKVIEVSQKIGYIKAPQTSFIQADEIKNYKPSEIVILCTGSQGEPLAALSRIAQGTHKQVKLMPGDTVIFSSSPIPGNQVSVNQTINALFKAGCEVITHSPITDTHTSGHASQGDLKLLFTLLKPKNHMPIHGEYRMLKTSGALDIECGLDPENLFILKNGDVLEMKEGKCFVSKEKIKAEDIMIDGEINDLDRSIIHERKLLSDAGLFTLVFTILKDTRRLALEPQFVTRGFIYLKGSEELSHNLVEMAKNRLIKLLNDPKLDFNQIKHELNKQISQIVNEQTGRNPSIITIFSFI